MKKDAEDKNRNRDKVIVSVFKKHYRKSAVAIPFSMDDIREAIRKVSQENPSYQENNVADVRYQYTSGRRSLPKEIDELGPWMIEGRGKANYAFIRLKESLQVSISPDLHIILLPDATPEIVLEYAGSDEQGILAKLRYNRILDIFLGITCYHLQNHWRTSVKNKGQLEIDDLYVGLDVDGKQYVVPIEAKGRKDRISKTQIVQNVAFARERYPKLIIRPVGIQEIHDKEIVAMEFTAGKKPDAIKIKEMRRYKLVPMSECTVNE